MKLKLFVLLFSLILHFFRAAESFAVSKPKQSESIFVRCLKEFKWDEKIPVQTILAKRAIKQTDFVHRIFELADGSKHTVRFFVKDWRDLGNETQNFIFDKPRPTPQDLVSKTYTYVYTLNEELIFGRVDDVLEYGVKHINLADDREIVIAGELLIDHPSSRVFYNALSGSYSFVLSKRYSPEYVDQLTKCMQPVFEDFFENKKTVVETKRSLFPSNFPSDERMEKLCSNDSIYVHNMRSLCDYFRAFKAAQVYK